MPDWLNDWLDRLSAGQLALVFCVFFIGITWLGIVLIHPVMRRLLHRGEPSNEPIIHIAGNFGLFFAVLLGLLTVAAFENTKSLHDNISREASSLSTIYRSADVYPEPLRGELKAELRDYTHYVIEKDWPAHRRGVVPEGGEPRLQVIRATLMSYELGDETQELLHNELFRISGRNDGASRATAGGRQRSHSRRDVVHGRHRRVTHHCLSVDASHGFDATDHFGRHYCVLLGES